MFAFKEETETKFILSERLEEQEKDFYQFSEEEASHEYIYDGHEMLVENMAFLEGYADYRNNTLISVNLLAKLLFHKDILKTEGIIKPLQDKEITEIAKKLVNHQINLYGSLDQESYVFFHNAIKTELLDIISAEEEEALDIILNSIFFNEYEKKAAKNVFEQKDKYFTSFTSMTIVEEALSQNVKVGEKVGIRNGVFEKRYIVHPAIVYRYFKHKIDEFAELEKQALTDPEGVPIEVLDEIEALKEEIITGIEKIDPDNIVFGKAKNIKFLLAQAVLKGLLNSEKLDQINPDLKKMEESGWDTYRILGYIKAFVQYVDMNILTYAVKKQKLNPIVMKMARERIMKVKDAIYNKKQLNKLKEKYGYKDITINIIKYFK